MAMFGLTAGSVCYLAIIPASRMMLAAKLA